VKPVPEMSTYEPSLLSTRNEVDVGLEIPAKPANDNAPMSNEVVGSRHLTNIPTGPASVSYPPSGLKPNADEMPTTGCE